MSCSTDRIPLRAARTPWCGSESVPGWTGGTEYRTDGTTGVSHGVRHHGINYRAHCRCCHWTRPEGYWRGRRDDGCGNWTDWHVVLVLEIPPVLQNGALTCLGETEREKKGRQESINIHNNLKDETWSMLPSAVQHECNNLGILKESACMFVVRQHGRGWNYWCSYNLKTLGQT